MQAEEIVALLIAERNRLDAAIQALQELPTVATVRLGVKRRGGSLPREVPPLASGR